MDGIGSFFGGDSTYAPGTYMYPNSPFSGSGGSSFDYGKGAMAVSDIFASVGKIVGISRAGGLSDRALKTQAQQVLINREFEAKQSERLTERAIAKGRAIGAASGVDPSSGTIKEVLADAAREGYKEALTIRTAGLIEANAIKWKQKLARLTTQSNRGAAIGDLGDALVKNKTILQELASMAGGLFS